MKLENPSDSFWLIYYFRIGLECDSPILECLYFTLPIYLVGEDLGAFLCNIHNQLEVVLDNMINIPPLTHTNDDQRIFQIVDFDNGYELRLDYIKNNRMIELFLKNQDAFYVSRATIYGRGEIVLSLMSASNPEWVISEENLGLVTYASQIHRVLKELISLSPAFWQQRKVLPDKIDF